MLCELLTDAKTHPGLLKQILLLYILVYVTTVYQLLIVYMLRCFIITVVRNGKIMQIFFIRMSLLYIVDGIIVT